MKSRIENFKKIIDQNKKLNFIISDVNYEKIKIEEGKLSNFCYVIKDNISLEGHLTTGGSSFLKNYIAPYSATIIELLNKEGAIPIAKSNLDEFGLGGTGTFSYNGDVLNPFDEKRITGGSSSGSAVAIAINACDFSLGTDTGDSIRRPSSFLGIIGYKPTYGLISRYGVLPYAPSFDHVGLFSKDIQIIQLVMSVIAKHDDKDFTSQDVNIDFLNKKENKNFNIAVLNETLNDVRKEVIDLFHYSLNKIKNVNIKKQDFDEKILKIIPSIYKIISYSEAVSCYQNMTGITFGENMGGKDFEEIATNNRTKNFGNELKRRFIIGSFCTSEDNYNDLFLKAKKIRTLVINAINKVFEKNDFIISLGASDIAPLNKDVKEKKVKDKLADNYLQIANFGGYPSITIPMGYVDKMPIGINIMGKLNSDSDLLFFAKKLIKDLNFGVKND
ncbi:MAG: amidase family protein [Mycoplasmoidaceae bacterium]